MDVAAAILAPAAVVSAVVGLFHASAYLVIFGRFGWHSIGTLILAILGAYVADALLGPGSILRLGDYSLLWASVGAWVGIAAVELGAWYRARRRAGAGPAPAPARPSPESP